MKLDKIGTIVPYTTVVKTTTIYDVVIITDLLGSD